MIKWFEKLKTLDNTYILEIFVEEISNSELSIITNQITLLLTANMIVWSVMEKE